MLRIAAPDLRTVTLCAVVLSILGALTATHAPPGTVWLDHLETGRLMIVGIVPDNPTYPMWGFSFLAALFGTSLPWAQAAAATAVAVAWLSTLAAQQTDTDLVRRPGPAVAVAGMMAPWFALATSYYSNSSASIFALGGTTLLLIAHRQRRWLRFAVAAGLLLGLASNVRSEFILLTVLLALCVPAAGIGSGRWRQPRRWALAGVVLTTCLATMIPWATYAHSTTGEFRLTSSNSAAVRYLGLGTLPDNPWGIVFQDDYVNKLAEDAIGSPTAWTSEADRYFSALFIQAIKSDPSAFLRRVAIGCRNMLLQGVYVPNLRALFAGKSEDQILVGLAAERIKERLGFPPDRYLLDEARARDIHLGELRIRHFVVIGSEIALRAVFAFIFIGLICVLFALCLFRRQLHLLTWVATAYLLHAFFLAGVVQASPRHSTLLLPILIGAVCVSLGPRRPQTDTEPPRLL